MIDGKKVLAVITARGNSKRLPHKNILDVGGRPLIAWSIEAAKNSLFIDRFILSSDDDKIIQTARKWGCEAPFKRPPELACDETLIEHVLIHALDSIKEAYDYIVLLQPTSPLRTPKDIDECIALCNEHGASACVSVFQTKKSPYWTFRVDESGCMTPFLRAEEPSHPRQNLLNTHMVNGAVYVAEVPWYIKNQTFFSANTVAYIMPPERSVDIDTKLDLMLVESIMNAGKA